MGLNKRPKDMKWEEAERIVEAFKNELHGPSDLRPHTHR